MIKLFLDLLKILENKSLTEDLTATMALETDTGGSNYWYLWIPGSLLLIFVIIFLAWRRRKSLESDKKA